MSKFKNLIVKGIAWRSFADFGQMFLQIAFTALLARMLTRADFGLVAMALLVNRFVLVVTQIGFGSAIIQSQEITENQISAIFFFITIANFLISSVCYLGAPLVSIFFEQPALLKIVQTLSWLVFLNSFSFPQIILRKRLNFKSYSILELSSMVAGNIVGIYLAFNGFGVWALVYRLVVQKAMFVFAIWLVAKWFPIRPDFTGTKKFFRFGFHMLLSNIVYYFSQNTASIIIGKFIGVETLGSFNIAYNLAIVPAQKVQSILTSVLTPGFSSLIGNLNEFRHKIYVSLFSLSILYFPLMGGLAAVSNNLVSVVYGEKWNEAGTFLLFLAIVGMLKGLEHFFRSILIARGWSKIIFKITLAEGIFSLPLLIAGCHFFGVPGLVAAYISASFLAFVLTVSFSQKAANYNTLFQTASSRSLFSAFCMFIVVFVPFNILRFPESLELALQIFLGAAIYVSLRFKLMSHSELKILDKIYLVNRMIKKMGMLNAR